MIKETLQGRVPSSSWNLAPFSGLPELFSLMLPKINFCAPSTTVNLLPAPGIFLHHATSTLVVLGPYSPDSLKPLAGSHQIREWVLGGSEWIGMVSELRNLYEKWTITNSQLLAKTWLPLTYSDHLIRHPSLILSEYCKKIRGSNMNIIHVVWHSEIGIKSDSI